MKPLAHFLTITRHKILVAKHCFRVGLYWQGLTHDLSKYSPSEFWPGARYYQGNRSPNEAERSDKGYSGAWLHHKGRNRHHLEYWLDYSPVGDHRLCGMKMPPRYLAEMFCDRMAASKIYRGKNYRDRDPYDYYMHARDHCILHPDTRAGLEAMLTVLKDEGEEAAFAYVRREILGKDS